MTDYIDLNIIERNLNHGNYFGTASFVQDVRKMWIKAYNYLATEESIKASMREISETFEAKISEIYQQQHSKIVKVVQTEESH